MRTDFHNSSIRAFIILCVGLALLGIYFRFDNRNWNENTNLHPDEYGLTNTISQLNFPENINEYFNTRLSPISPYQKYDQTGQPTIPGPDNAFRWGQFPIILIRGVAELLGQTSYNELRLLGRTLSAIMDVLTIICISLIGYKLFGVLQGLVAAALTSLSVLSIQQSHFMTVDNFATFFASFSILCAVMMSCEPLVSKTKLIKTVLNWKIFFWGFLFSVGFGAAIASKINLLPLLGIGLLAVFISLINTEPELKYISRRNIFNLFLTWIFILMVAFMSFRICQPMSFRSSLGETNFFTFRLNVDWVQNMKLASTESGGGVFSPPAEQWADRPAIIFPLLNMILWGMGIPLGLSAWVGFVYACMKSISKPKLLKRHLLLLVWVGGFFLFMGTRWVKSMRYFLPIYPFLSLLAAWFLVELWLFSPATVKHRWIRAVPIFLVLMGTFIWATAFVKTVYGQRNTRVEANEWIFNNIPAPIHLQGMTTEGDVIGVPISVPDLYLLTKETPYTIAFQPNSEVSLIQVVLPKVRTEIVQGVDVEFSIFITDPTGEIIIGQAEMSIVPSLDNSFITVSSGFSNVSLESGAIYFLTISTPSETGIRIGRNVIGVEEWDEGLPMPFDEYNPFGQFYNGVTILNRWPDNEEKRSMYIQSLAEIDYVIISSQRGLWSTCRLPNIYPLTITYYQSLFDGTLGYDLINQVQHPIEIGPLNISDLAGRISLWRQPELPVCNFNIFAAEEAFSVYDHAPVWIFKKTSWVTEESVESVLSEVDISGVQFVPLTEVTVEPIK